MAMNMERGGGWPLKINMPTSTPLHISDIVTFATHTHIHTQIDDIRLAHYSLWIWELRMPGMCIVHTVHCTLWLLFYDICSVIIITWLCQCQYELYSNEDVKDLWQTIDCVDDADYDVRSVMQYPIFDQLGRDWSSQSEAVIEFRSRFTKQSVEIIAGHLHISNNELCALFNHESVEHSNESTVTSTIVVIWYR